MLDRFTPQGLALKAHPTYWNKSAVHVPEISYPAYTQNFNVVNPPASGQIDLAGNDIANVQGVYLGRSPTNHTWVPSAPHLTANNLHSLLSNCTNPHLTSPTRPPPN